jgi:hypothetical protein
MTPFSRNAQSMRANGSVRILLEWLEGGKKCKAFCVETVNRDDAELRRDSAKTPREVNLILCL